MPIPPRMTVEGGFGGAAEGFTAGAGEAFIAFFASVGVAPVAAVVAPLFASAGLLVIAGVPGVAVANFVSIGGTDFVLRPNIGDQAKPMRGAKLKLLSMLFWFS